MTLANPLGLFALLGIPAVLAVHFLQRQATVLPISTLFLLEKTQRESASGRRFDRLMNSVPLWMQLLGVLLLAWLLAEPRYQKARSTQRVAVVLDSSASMSVFKETLRERLAAALPELQGPAAALELTLLESTPGRERLYSGPSVDDALVAFDAWQPRDGLTDPSHALRLARSLVAREGIVVYATDTPLDTPPFDARLLSVGHPVGNVGVTGVSFATKEGALVWTALVRNYGETEASRTWQFQFPDGGASEPKPFTIGAGSIVSLQGAFPGDAERARLVLSADEFTLDDIVPLVTPQPKSLTLFASTAPVFTKLSERLLRSLEAIKPTNDASKADLSLVSYDPLDPVLPPGNAVVFVDDATSAGAYLKGGIIAEKHPLVDGLNWQALLVRETIQLERLPTDDVLLWQDTRPLIFLREIPGDPGMPPTLQLCFNFDLNRSNATSQPAFIVCLHRFAESLRATKVAEFRDNLETGQPVELAAHPPAEGQEAEPVVMEHFDPAGKSLSRTTIPPAARVRITAPLDPGFLKVTQGETGLLDGSLHFADAREADFNACDAADSLDQGSAEAIQRHTTEDHWWRAWIVILVAVLLVSWYFSKDNERRSADRQQHPPPGADLEIGTPS